MIQTRKELKFYIQSDRIMAGYEELPFIQKVKHKLISPPILSYLKHMRCCSFYKHHRGVICKLLFTYHFLRYKKLGLKLGFSIGYDAFGYGLHIPHYGTIVVNNDSTIGNYCVLHTSICIGGAGKIIGNGLYVGSGAMIMGAIKLGNGVSVASQSLVNKDFLSDNILLTGTPAYIKKNSKVWYERDGSLYSERVKRIENLKKSYGL